MNAPRLFLPLVLLFPGLATAQEPSEVPKPAPELQQLAPLIGNWQGSGTAQMGPGEPSKWESHSTYAWALDNFFVQEDTIVRFAGMPQPLVMRTYLGWDAENARYVAISADNDGHVAVSRLEVPGDGSFVTLADKYHEGRSYLERYTSKVNGESMTFAIDMMGASGPSMQPVVGSMKRTDKPVAMALDASLFTASPAAPIEQLGKTAGTFAVSASMVMPGAPAMKITGQDEVKPLFDGTIVHVHTTGSAEGFPGNYVGELFYGYDERDDCLRAVYVSNRGETAQMNGAFTADGKALILTSAIKYAGQLSVQRMTIELGPDGAPTKSVGHTILGAAAPFESWNATYTKK
jgi:hypothetical protein